MEDRPFDILIDHHIVERNVTGSGFDFAIDHDGDVIINHDGDAAWVGTAPFAALFDAARDEYTEAVTETEEPDDNTDGRATNLWEDDDILLQNSSNTVGLAETEDALKVLSADAQSVLVTPSLLREALDVADGIGENAAVWLTVEHDRPALVTPTGEMRRLSAVVTPRINDETPPAEDI